MAERLDLTKTVYNKAEYIKTIDTSFNEFGTTTLTEDLIVQPTIEEFFTLYNSLFYEIPALGETNSHQYLVRTSGEYINFDEVNDEIQALQAEIAQLRQDLLNAQMDNVRQVAAEVDNPQTNEALEVLQRELNNANQNLIETNTELSQNTNTSVNTPSVGSTTSTSTGGGSVSGGGSPSGGGGTPGGGGGGY
jgi:hypothetical protein